MTDDMGKLTEEWRKRNPFIVWRTRKNLTHEQAAAELRMDVKKFMELEVAAASPREQEWPEITRRTGITEDQWKRWLMSKPHVRVVPPTGQPPQ